MPIVISTGISTLVLDLERQFKVKTKRRFGYLPTGGGHPRGLVRTWAELQTRLPSDYWATIMLVNKSDYPAVRATLSAYGPYTEIHPVTPSAYPSLKIRDAHGRQYIVTVTTLSGGCWLP